jgi:hypothetical protein
LVSWTLWENPRPVEEVSATALAVLALLPMVTMTSQDTTSAAFRQERRVR